MVIKRSSSAEVARLIDVLFASDKTGQEAAAARLAILGSRAIPGLTAALSSLSSEPSLISVLDVLERIGDPHALELVAPLLTDERDRVAGAAASVVGRILESQDAEAAARATDALVAVVMDVARPDAVKRAALDALNRLPEDVLAPLRRTLEADHRAPEPATQRPSDASLLEWIARPERMVPVDEIRRALGECTADTPLALLHRVIQRLRQIEAASPAAGEWIALRGLAHQMLAKRESRIALYDLRETVERAPSELTVSMLAAMNELGDASCLEPLAEAWRHIEDPWMKDQLREVFQTIVNREALTRRHSALKRVAARHPSLLDALSTPSQTRPSPRQADRR